MSVINKVLRDLDQRQGTGLAVPTAADQRLRSGTASVTMPEAAAPATPVRRGWVVAAAVVLALLAGAAALWQTGIQDLLPTKAPPTVSPPAAQQTQTALPVPAVAGSVAQGVATPAVPPVVAMPPSIELSPPASRFDSTLVLPKDPKPLVLQPSVPAPAKSPAPSAVVAAVVTPPAAPAPPPAAAVAAPPAPTAAELAQKQQQAARDALAQAQALWNTGSRDAAVDLLQQAVVSTERAAQAAPSAGSTQTLVLLVRELGRMQLAEGRPVVVWDTLARLEPLLRNEPEMWALRANAAQRLGRHQDSVHAYMTALQSRPNEQRWLLGAAVSLAALGQTASATEMAEKARSAGPISREVQTYLRQMGVPLKDL